LTQSGETQSFEIIVKGISVEELENSFLQISGSNLMPKANGATIQVLNENDIEKVLQITKNAGGNLVSVQPVKQSLEELFVNKNQNREQ
jgi:hypothetical protein